MGYPGAACFDSDILIDFLQGRPQAADAMAGVDVGHISIMTWIEVMTGAMRGGTGDVARAALASFIVHPTTPAIAETSVDLRVVYRLRTPDAVIWATAKELEVPLLTRNERDFPATDPGIHIPYRI